jgi:hypothetical protein
MGAITSSPAPAPAAAEDGGTAHTRAIGVAPSASMITGAVVVVWLPLTAAERQQALSRSRAG